MSDCGFLVPQAAPDPKISATGNKLYLAVSLSGALPLAASTGPPVAVCSNDVTVATSESDMVFHLSLPKKATRKRAMTTARITGARNASARNRRSRRDAYPQPGAMHFLETRRELPQRRFQTQPFQLRRTQRRYDAPEFLNDALCRGTRLLQA